MATILELLFRLEKRVLSLEMQLGITPTKEVLLHPKSYSQAQERVEKARIEADILAAQIEETP